jgi:hypothetical protein
MIIKRSSYTYNVNRVTHCSAEDSMLSYDKHAHQEPCLKPRQPGVCSVHERKASTHVPLFMQLCVSHSKRTTRVRVSTSTEVVSRFSAVIPHNFFFVVQRGTPQVSTTKGRSCTSQPSADTPRPPTCFADPSPGNDQGTLEAKRGGRWARAGAGPNPECALTCLARKGKIHSNVRVLAGIKVALQQRPTCHTSRPGKQENLGIDKKKERTIKDRGPNETK